MFIGEKEPSRIDMTDKSMKIVYLGKTVNL